jgi:hypothetical protein
MFQGPPQGGFRCHGRARPSVSLEALSEGRSQNGLVSFTGENGAHPQRGSLPFRTLLGRSPKGRSSQTSVSLPGFIDLGDPSRADVSGWRRPPRPRGRCRILHYWPPPTAINLSRQLGLGALKTPSPYSIGFSSHCLPSTPVPLLGMRASRTYRRMRGIAEHP